MYGHYGNTHLAHPQQVKDGLAAHVGDDDHVLLPSTVAGSDGLCRRLGDRLCVTDQILCRRLLV